MKSAPIPRRREFGSQSVYGQLGEPGTNNTAVLRPGTETAAALRQAALRLLNTGASGPPRYRALSELIGNPR